jgi:hypothetical protein
MHFPSSQLQRPSFKQSLLLRQGFGLWTLAFFLSEEAAFADL